jgi:hypothetical protein
MQLRRAAAMRDEVGTLHVALLLPSLTASSRMASGATARRFAAVTARAQGLQNGVTTL